MNTYDCFSKDIDLTISIYLFGMNIVIYRYSNDKNKYLSVKYRALTDIHIVSCH